MKIIKPIIFESSQLVSTTATNAEADWSSATTYALGDIRTYGTNRYESLQASNTNNQPDISPTWWLDLGANNQYAMFDQFVSTDTTATTSLTAVYAPGSLFDSLALINVDAAVITVTIRDGISGPIVYESTAGLSGAESYSWSDYFFNDPLLKRTQIIFSDIPPYLNAHITIELTNSTGTAVNIGHCIAGDLATLGTTQYGATAGIIDYSVKETDDFGNTSFVKRAFSKRLNTQFHLKNSELNRVQNYIYSIRATPAVWIASDDPTFEETLIVYGFYRDFSTEIAYPTHSMCSIEVEGLT